MTKQLSETEWLALMRKHKFKVGQRVRISEYGRDANIVLKKHLDRSGVVTRVDQFNCPTIRWEGRKTTSSYYGGFIEPDRRRKRS